MQVEAGHRVEFDHVHKIQPDAFAHRNFERIPGVVAGDAVPGIDIVDAVPIRIKTTEHQDEFMGGRPRLRGIDDERSIHPAADVPGIGRHVAMVRMKPEGTGGKDIVA